MRRLECAVIDSDQQFLERYLPRRRFVEAEHPTHGRFRQTAAVLAGQREHVGPYQLRDDATTDTVVLRDAGPLDLLPNVAALIGMSILLVWLSVRRFSKVSL